MKGPIPISATSRGARVVVEVLDWYSSHGADYSWRENNQSSRPWVVLVSEVMLQQTQTRRVEELLPPFLVRYPDPESCSAATNAEIVRAWKGLGYNNRAIRLRDAAIQIQDRHAGDVPSDVALLIELPGIGDYTAKAIATFAFGEEHPLVEVNTRRVLSRLFFRCYDTTQVVDRYVVERVSRYLMPPGRGEEWNQGLMDYGATVCTQRNPRCGECKLSVTCTSGRKFHKHLLYSKAIATRNREPELHGDPIRIWRGRMVRALTRCSEPISVSELLERVLIVSDRKKELEGSRYTDLLLPLTRLIEDRLVQVWGRNVQSGESPTMNDLVSLRE